jgi:hypothetical protein
VGELGDDVAGQIIVGWHGRAGVGVAHDAVAQPGLRLLRGRVGEPGDELQVHPSGAVEADVECVGKVRDMLGHGRGRTDGALREATGLADEPSLLVGLLQRHDEVTAGLLAFVGASVPPAAQAAEPAGERLIRLVELPALVLHLRVDARMGGVELQCLQLTRKVAQPDHAAQTLRVVAVAVRGLHDGLVVAVPDHATFVDRVLERRRMIRPDHDLRRRQRFAEDGVRRLHARRGELRVEPFREHPAELVRVAVERDVEVAAVTAEHRLDDAHRVGVEAGGDHAVDVDRHIPVAGHLHGRGMHPRLVRHMVERPAALAQHQHVGDGLGAGLPAERGGREPDHCGELGLAGQVGAHRLRPFVERVAARQQHGGAAGTQRVDRAFDEVVVQRETRRGAVEQLVVDADVARIGHVADRHVE